MHFQREIWEPQTAQLQTILEPEAQLSQCYTAHTDTIGVLKQKKKHNFYTLIDTSLLHNHGLLS